MGYFPLVNMVYGLILLETVFRLEQFQPRTCFTSNFILSGTISHLDIFYCYTLLPMHLLFITN